MGLTRIRAQQITDIDYKQAARVVTSENVNLSGGAPNQVDGVDLANGNRILVNGQTNRAQNGLYQVATVGTGSNGTWTRTNDADKDGEIEPGMLVMVTEGVEYADTLWKLTTNGTIQIGVTELTFVLNTPFGFGNISANGTGVSATVQSDTLTLTASDNINITGNAVSKTIEFGLAETITGNLIPSANVTYDLGSSANRWKDIWLSNSTIYLGDAILSANGNQLLIDNQSVITSTSADSLTLSGNIAGGNISGTNGEFTNVFGNGSALTSITGANVTGVVANSTYAVSAGSSDTATTAGTVTTNAQPNITSVGTLSALTVSGNIIGNNVLIQLVGEVRFFDSDNSNYVALRSADAVTGNIVWTLPAADGTVGQVLATDGAGNLLWTTGGSGGGGISWTTQADTPPVIAEPGDFWYDSTTQIKYQYINDGIGNAWVDQSSPTVFETVTTGSIVNSNANGVGNIGSSTNYFDTVFAKATSAQYADLAEVYESDDDYPPATVVVFGGSKEVTISTKVCDTRVAGIVSTDPAFTMNTRAEGVMVALTGRVPCRVQGPVAKGDVLITSNIPGTAQRIGQQWQPGCVIGKSLQDIEDSTCQIIEVAVGRF